MLFYVKKRPIYKGREHTTERKNSSIHAADPSIHAEDPSVMLKKLKKYISLTKHKNPNFHFLNRFIK